MQDYISDPRNKEKICRIKLALTHLEACDIAGEEIEIDTLSGYVEPFFGLGDYRTWGDLGWLQDWYIRPVFKKTKSLLDYSSIRQSSTYKYRRRGSLGKLYQPQLDRDYALFGPPIFSHIESKGWRDYIWTYLLLRRRERYFGYPGVTSPSDKDVEDLLIQACKFTITRPTGVLYSLDNSIL
jgi:hypothetical protein